MKEAAGNIKVPAGKLFEDASFPADGSSTDWGKNESTKWYRPTQFETSPSLYGKAGVNPGAVNQGGLGDCWYLAAMAAIGEWPDRIKTILNNQKSWPKDGQFKVNLYAYGNPIQLKIDDRLPGSVRGNRLSARYARKSPNGAWWAPILEKAGAKYWGHYKRMSGGWMNDAFEMLTGFPTSQFRNSDMSANDLYNKLDHLNKKNYIMSSAFFKKDGIESYGLVSQHAYTVLGVDTYKGEKLVRIRNPWGVEKYTGPWNDKTDKWTEDAKKQLKHTTKNDGQFFVPLKIYHENFYNIQACHYQDWKRASKMESYNRKNQPDIRKVSHKFNNPVNQEFAV